MIVSIFYPIKEKFNKKTKLITLFVICGLFMSFYVVQFLTWAPVGTTNFDDFGISTRYFVPLFSLIPVVINVNYDDKFEIKYFDKYIITSVIIFLGGLIIYVVSIVY